MILGVNDVLESNINNTLLIQYLLGMITSCIVTYFSIKWFKNIMEKGKLKYFIYYCLLIGLLVIIFL